MSRQIKNLAMIHELRFESLEGNNKFWSSVIQIVDMFRDLASSCSNTEYHNTQGLSDEGGEGGRG